MPQSFVPRFWRQITVNKSPILQEGKKTWLETYYVKVLAKNILIAAEQ